MTAIGLCILCRPIQLGDFLADPSHCFGTGDNPAPKGVMGGFRCSCACREAPKP